jgi:hypothetical protein
VSFFECWTWRSSSCGSWTFSYWQRASRHILNLRAASPRPVSPQTITTRATYLLKAQCNLRNLLFSFQSHSASQRIVAPKLRAPFLGVVESYIEKMETQGSGSRKSWGHVRRVEKSSLPPTHWRLWWFLTFENDSLFWTRRTFTLEIPCLWDGDEDHRWHFTSSESPKNHRK